MTDLYFGQFAALGTACCWTVTSMVFESAGKRVGSLAVNLIRLAIALLPLSLYCFAVRGRALPTDASGSAWFWLSLSGLTGFTFGDLCLFRAFVVIGSRISVVLMALVPPMTALLGWWIMGERLAATDWLGMWLTIAGVIWVVRERQPDGAGGFSRLPLRGALLGIGGAFGQSMGLVLSKLGMADYHPAAANQIRIIAGLAGFSLLFVFIGWWPKVATAVKNRGAMFRTSLGAFFGPFLGVSLSLTAVKHTEAGVAATLMSLVPVLILPPALLIKKETITARAAFGAFLAVAGAALLFL